MIIEFDSNTPTVLERGEFLTRLRDEYAISKIYYPGVGNDQQLEAPFGNAVYSLDRFKIPLNLSGNFIKGDMICAPFRNEVFDAIFIQDIHADEEELDDILRTLKPSGLIIFSLDDCVGGDIDDLADLEKHPYLQAINLPYQNEIFKVFKKGTSHINTVE